MPEHVAQEASPAPHLLFEMRHRVGSLALDLGFALTRPWSLLFAPSGAGKTTILRAIAGLIEPESASIVALSRSDLRDGGTLLTEFVLTDTANGISVAPHRRGVRMVAQNAALFPHLSVCKNIAYNAPDRAQPPRNPQDAHQFQALLALCRVEHLTAKMPAQLSGGERQRVALARSLAAPGCRLLLLDEPFTALDAELRDELIADLSLWLADRDVPVLSVTHDISEAFQIDAEVIRLLDGRVVAQGAATEVLAEERERLLAQLTVGS